MRLPKAEIPTGLFVLKLTRCELLDHGETVAALGNSGAGKTQLTLAMARGLTWRLVAAWLGGLASPHLRNRVRFATAIPLVNRRLLFTLLAP